MNRRSGQSEFVTTQPKSWSLRAERGNLAYLEEIASSLYFSQ